MKLNLRTQSTIPGSTDSMFMRNDGQKILKVCIPWINFLYIHNSQNFVFLNKSIVIHNMIVSNLRAEVYREAGFGVEMAWSLKGHLLGFENPGLQWCDRIQRGWMWPLTPLVYYPGWNEFMVLENSETFYYCQGFHTVTFRSSVEQHRLAGRLSKLSIHPCCLGV